MIERGRKGGKGGGERCGKGGGGEESKRGKGQKPTIHTLRKVTTTLAQHLPLKYKKTHSHTQSKLRAKVQPIKALLSQPLPLSPDVDLYHISHLVPQTKA